MKQQESKHARAKSKQLIQLKELRKGVRHEVQLPDVGQNSQSHHQDSHSSPSSQMKVRKYTRNTNDYNEFSLNNSNYKQPRIHHVVDLASSGHKPKYQKPTRIPNLSRS
jgi:hypothetical protein